MSKKTNNIKKKIGLFLGPLIFIVFLLAPFADISFSAKGGLGLLFWMIIWWISRPVNPTVTALLPIPVIALTGIVPIEYVLAKYFSPIVVLLLGANILTVAWQRWGLDKRLALLVLTKVGSSVRVQVTVWFVLTVVLSSIIPNVIVAATLIPIVLATLKASGINSGDIYHSEYATGILLAVAWGSSIGFGTPLGGSMNLVVIQMIEDMVIHQEFMFITWITHMFPLMLAISVPMLLILLNFKYETDKLAIAGDVFKKEYKDLGEFNSGEKWGIIVFVCAILLAFLRPLYLDYLPGLQPSYIFLIAGLIMLLATDKEGERILTWEYAQPRLMWGMYILFSGGIALGSIIGESGADAIIINFLTPLSKYGNLGIAIAFCLLAVLLSNVMTITGSLSVVIPLMITTLQNLNIPPMPFVYMVAATANIAIMFPSSSGGPAIVASLGIDLSKMAKRGALTVLITLPVAILVGFLLMLFWPGFSQ